RKWNPQSIDEYAIERQQAREKHQLEMANVSTEPAARTTSLHRRDAKNSPRAALLDDLRPEPLGPRRASLHKAALSRRRSDRPGKLVPKRPSHYVDRRAISLLGNSQNDGKISQERRRAAERRRNSFAIPFPDRRLSRSAYEQVFLKLVSGGRLRMGGDVYTPIGMKGWYHAIFRRESDGAERLLTIDQLLKKMGDWV
ncbi:MAG TPA: hypothetical protein VF608_13640, partial [Thermoanaerobaculia bacterium]